jgi:predicted transcriptional regulator
MRKRSVRHFLTKPRGRLETTDTNMTFSMPRDTAARLSEIALARGTNLQGVVELAVNEWLARQLSIAGAGS